MLFRSEEKLLSAPLETEYSSYLSWAEDLLERAEPKVLVAKLLSSLNSRTAKGYNLGADLERERERRSRGTGRGEYAAGAPRRSGSRPRGTMTRLRSSQGGARDVGRVLNIKYIPFGFLRIQKSFCKTLYKCICMNI